VVLTQEKIDGTARAKFVRGQASQLLALIDMDKLSLPYDATTLLQRVFTNRDSPGFLQQTGRSNISTGFDNRIEESVAGVERTSPNEALAWNQNGAYICRGKDLRDT